VPTSWRQTRTHVRSRGCTSPALELAGLVRDAGFDDVAEKLEVAYDRETKVLALGIGVVCRFGAATTVHH
jgi:hypothetical protein